MAEEPRPRPLQPEELEQRHQIQKIWRAVNNQPEDVVLGATQVQWEFYLALLHTTPKGIH